LLNFVGVTKTLVLLWPTQISSRGRGPPRVVLQIYMSCVVTASAVIHHHDSMLAWMTVADSLADLVAAEFIFTGKGLCHPPTPPSLQFNRNGSFFISSLGVFVSFDLLHILFCHHMPWTVFNWAGPGGGGLAPPQPISTLHQCWIRAIGKQTVFLKTKLPIISLNY
jgi:hypothetical protein